MGSQNTRLRGKRSKTETNARNGRTSTQALYFSTTYSQGWARTEIIEENLSHPETEVSQLSVRTIHFPASSRFHHELNQ
jgi:hypothetical protein